MVRVVVDMQPHTLIRNLLNLGSFTNKKEAINVRRRAELKYFKEFTPYRKEEVRNE